jgi:acyl dehydratase
VRAEEEMKAFAVISGDHNPLHFDAQYAAATRFKRPIVFGVLMSAFACFSVLSMNAGSFFDSVHSCTSALD